MVAKKTLGLGIVKPRQGVPNSIFTQAGVFLADFVRIEKVKVVDDFVNDVAYAKYLACADVVNETIPGFRLILYKEREHLLSPRWRVTIRERPANPHSAQFSAPRDNCGA
jgi:hypothetical protein